MFCIWQINIVLYCKCDPQRYCTLRNETKRNELRNEMDCEILYKAFKRERGFVIMKLLIVRDGGSHPVSKMQILTKNKVIIIDVIIFSFKLIKILRFVSQSISFRFVSQSTVS